MERIFEDDTLVIGRDMTAVPVASEDLAAANARAADAEARAAAAEQRARDLEARIDEARRNAQDPGDGTSGRLKAAAKARAEAQGDKEPPAKG
jgi:septal ring factor EnvC (AmiA/AmiB activator)